LPIEFRSCVTPDAVTHLADLLLSKRTFKNPQFIINKHTSDILQVKDPTSNSSNQDNTRLLKIVHNSTMASPSFHPFPKLPAELRLQIWNDACVVRHLNHHGLHYIDVGRLVDGMSLFAFHPQYGHTSVTSACLMDNGLWTACKESRDVIKGWLDAVGQGKPSHRASFTIRGSEGEPYAYCTVNPWQDIFCIQASDWCVLHDHSKP
jgi:hypothetical protein